MSASTYVGHYDKTWERLMQRQGRFLLEEYGDRNVLTTWTISYEQVRKQSEEAACLLGLWRFLDHGELWYELVAAGLRLNEEMDTPTWLLTIAGDELEYADAVGPLSRYSLADARKAATATLCTLCYIDGADGWRKARSGTFLGFSIISTL